MRSWIATLACVALLSGCSAHRAHEHSAPAPDSNVALTGTYDDGLRDGEQDAMAASVAGWFVLGAVTAPLIVLCVVAAASGGGSSSGGDCGGGGGNCGSGSSGGGHSVVPMDAHVRTPSYLDGYNKGYESKLSDRQGMAFAGGFATGLALTLIGVIIYIADENRRDDLESEAGEHMTAGGKPRGATLLEF